MTLDPGILVTGSFFATALLDFRDKAANGSHKIPFERSQFNITGQMNGDKKLHFCADAALCTMLGALGTSKDRQLNSHQYYLDNPDISLQKQPWPMVVRIHKQLFYTQRFEGQSDLLISHSEAQTYVNQVIPRDGCFTITRKVKILSELYFEVTCSLLSHMTYAM